MVGTVGEQCPTLCWALPQALLCSLENPDNGLEATCTVGGSSEPPTRWT